LPHRAAGAADNLLFSRCPDALRRLARPVHQPV